MISLFNEAFCLDWGFQGNFVSNYGPIMLFYEGSKTWEACSCLMHDNPGLREIFLRFRKDYLTQKSWSLHHFEQLSHEG